MFYSSPSNSLAKDMNDITKEMVNIILLEDYSHLLYFPYVYAFMKIVFRPYWEIIEGYKNNFSHFYFIVQNRNLYHRDEAFAGLIFWL